MDTEQLQEELQKQLAKAQDGNGNLDVGGMLSGFSLWGIFWGFAFSVFGWFIFKHGRKNRNYGLIGIGIALMVYPYFIYNPWPCFLIGCVLCAAAYKIWNR